MSEKHAFTSRSRVSTVITSTFLLPPKSSRKLSGGAHKKLCRTAKQSAVFHPIGLGAAERISFSSRDFERATIRHQTFWVPPPESVGSRRSEVARHP